MADFGLYYYVARFYDPQLGRFSQADTVTPGGVQGLDRYAGMANNPLRYVDPTGHKACDEFDENGQCIVDPQWQKDKSCEKTIWFGDKLCKLVPVGEWNITTYNYALESDAGTTGGAHRGENVTITVCHPGGGGCVKVTAPFRFWFGSEGIMMAGTGILNDGRVIYVDSYTGEWVYMRNRTTYDYYDAQRASFVWGYGGPGRQMDPYYDAAVGSSYKGGLYYIPQLAGYKGSSGVFNGVDRGGAIADGEIDIFTGAGLAAQDNYLIDINKTPVYQVVCQE